MDIVVLLSGKLFITSYLLDFLLIIATVSVINYYQKYAKILIKDRVLNVANWGKSYGEEDR